MPNYSYRNLPSCTICMLAFCKQCISIIYYLFFNSYFFFVLVSVLKLCQLIWRYHNNCSFTCLPSRNKDLVIITIIMSIVLWFQYYSLHFNIVSKAIGTYLRRSWSQNTSPIIIIYSPSDILKFRLIDFPISLL